MVKAIVLYNSRTGNTKKVALKIAEGLKVDSHDKRNIPDLKEYDLVVLGSWVIMGRISFGGARYLRKVRRKIAGKKIALFFTSAGPDEIHWKTENKVPKTIKEIMFESMERIVNKKQNVTILPERFYCTGAIRMFGQDRDKIGHPTYEELEQAKAFGEQLKELLEA
ncbi:MAG: hypothetical protein H7644_00785 [Candidatus Heimdallarchaeota archaeon]|nr:hypothetical protein [Candidatus Heimdallarchaeota archaeon]MCK5142284.1 hypothetical protein [Candidatus Heimdallarchaeota archaeon]